METELAEFRDQIIAGKHKEWNQAVDMLRLGKTQKMGLILREAFLVVAFRHGQGEWGLAAAPTVTKDDALKAIAESYQEARPSAMSIPIVTKDGKVKYHPTDPTEKSTEEPGMMVSMPVGLVFVGQCGNRWADEVAFVGVDILGDLLGRSKEAELKLLNDFVFEAAHSRIEKLTAS